MGLLVGRVTTVASPAMMFDLTAEISREEGLDPRGAKRLKTMREGECGRRRNNQ